MTLDAENPPCDPSILPCLMEAPSVRSCAAAAAPAINLCFSLRESDCAPTLTYPWLTVQTRHAVSSSMEKIGSLAAFAAPGDAFLADLLEMASNRETILLKYCSILHN